MKGFFATVLGALGLNAAAIGSQGCWAFIIDEEECVQVLYDILKSKE